MLRLTGYLSSPLTPMTADELRNSLERPDALRAELIALWHDARGDWEQAHRVVQDLETSEAAWVHAYLHRREGDLSNARYWYDRAGRPPSTDSLGEEWTQIASVLLRA